MRAFDYINVVIGGALLFLFYKSFKGFKVGAEAISNYADAKIDQFQAKADLSSQNAFVTQGTSAQIAEIARLTGLDLKTIDDVFAAERQGLIYYDEASGNWYPYGGLF